jgi:hypothetical protein
VKTKYWIMLLAAMLVLCLGMSLLFLLPGEDAAYAQVIYDGKVLHTLDLQVDRELTVTTDRGTNVVTVRDGKIAVTDASCPDHRCMDWGFRKGGSPIVCLPNRLVLEFVAEGMLDAVAG